LFVNAYSNGDPGINPVPTEFTTIQVAPALDEGGNWLDVRFAPLSINDIDGFNNADEIPSDYHLAPGSVAIDEAAGGRPGGLDIDLEPGVSGSNLDIGSDEVQQ
jgi:hypothetical protein